MSTPTPRTVVIFASTGLQGTALIKALSIHNTPVVQWKIIALTRNATSGSATNLASLPGVTVLQVEANHMDDPAKCFESLGLEKGEIYGVFSNQGYVDDVAMLRQGKAIADASKEWGVKHLIYSSTDNGDMEDCGIAGFEVKRQVERYIETLDIPFTFLRPVQFMENYLPDSPFIFKMGRTIVMRYTYINHPERKHQLIASRDIGIAGAKAFVEGPGWMDGKVSLAGDSLTVKEIDEVFKRELGEPVQVTYGVLARFVKTVVPILRQMVNFFDNHGYRVNVPALRKELPELQDLQTFLQEYKAKQVKA